MIPRPAAQPQSALRKPMVPATVVLSTSVGSPARPTRPRSPARSSRPEPRV